MRIAHVIHEYMPEAAAGASLHVQDLAAAQQRRGHEPLVFTRAAGSGRPPLSLADDSHAGVPVTRMAYDFDDLRRFEQLYRHRGMDQVFGAWLARADVALVHFHHFTCLATSMLGVAHDLGLPVVVTLHDYWTQCPRGDRHHPSEGTICTELDRTRCAPCLMRLWPHVLPAHGWAGRVWRRLAPLGVTLRRLRGWDDYVLAQLRRADAWIAPSKFVHDRFVEWGLSAPRGHVIPHGLECDELRAPPRGEAPIRRIGCAGRLVPSKGALLLLEAFGRLERAGLELALHGPVSEDAAGQEHLRQLQAAIGALPRGMTAKLHGAYAPEELPRILRQIDCLVVPSTWWEPFGLTAREGASAGLPVVVSEIAGLADAVREGIALGFRAGDAGDLARVLTRLLDEPGLRAEMSRRGGRVREIGAAAADTDAVYARVTSGESAPRRG